MIRLFVIGDKLEKEFTEKLCRVLERFGGVFVLHDNAPVISNAKEEFLLYDCEKLQKIDTEKGILIFKTKQKNIQTDKISISTSIVSIVERENKKALQMLKNNMIPTLICGMSIADTLTLSSIEDNSAVIDLQREIYDLDKQIIEPCEIKINYDIPFTDYELLVVSGILLLSGKIKSGKYSIII